MRKLQFFLLRPLLQTAALIQLRQNKKAFLPVNATGLQRQSR